jgi:hypothetical protein
MSTRHEHQPSDLDTVPPPEERTVEVPQEQDGWDYEDQVSKLSNQGETLISGNFRCDKMLAKELALVCMSMTAVVSVVMVTT